MSEPTVTLRVSDVQALVYYTNEYAGKQFTNAIGFERAGGQQNADRTREVGWKASDLAIKVGLEVHRQTAQGLQPELSRGPGWGIER